MNYRTRVQALRKYLRTNHLDAMIIDDLLNIFYLTGMELSLGTLLVTQNSARLIVDNRYYETCKKQSPVPVFERKEGWLEKLLSQKSFSHLKSLGFDRENSSYAFYQNYKKLLRKVVKSNPQRKAITLKPLNNPIRSLRAIKDKEEIQKLKKAAKLGSEGYDYLLTLLKTGATELELAAELEIFWKKKGSKGLGFDPIIAFGPNSSMPHYKPSNAKLKKGVPVLIDIGVNLNHYHSDMTRVPFFGAPSKKMEKIYHVVWEAQEAALAFCKPGTTLKELDSIAREVISSHNFGKYFIHNLGHGIGLEIHEHPFIRGNSKETLEEGMLVTIEPGIYLPDIGGVRIEDTVLITKKGHENLTNRSKELTII